MNNSARSALPKNISETPTARSFLSAIRNSEKCPNIYNALAASRMTLVTTRLWLGAEPFSLAVFPSVFRSRARLKRSKQTAKHKREWQSGKQAEKCSARGKMPIMQMAKRVSQSRSSLPPSDARNHNQQREFPTPTAYPVCASGWWWRLWLCRRRWTPWSLVIFSPFVRFSIGFDWIYLVFGMLMRACAHWVWKLSIESKELYNTKRPAKWGQVGLSTCPHPSPKNKTKKKNQKERVHWTPWQLLKFSWPAALASLVGEDDKFTF